LTEKRKKRRTGGKAARKVDRELKKTKRKKLLRRR